MEIQVEKVLPNPEQPRKTFDQDGLQELADSILEVGLVQPITVEEADDGFFIIHDGERRLRACKLAGLALIRADVVPALNGTGPRERLERALVANIQREEMNPIEEARAFKRLMDEHGYTVRDVGRRIGKKGAAGYAYVRNRLIWLELEPEIQGLVAAGRLHKTKQVADAILTIQDPVTRVKLAERVAKKRISVRGVIAASEHINTQLQAVKFEDPTPSIRLARQKSGYGGPKPNDWDVIQQLGRVPPWDLIEKNARRTCKACALADIASPLVCGECGVVEFLRYLMEAA